jgi:uracil-DNA glycosylase
MKHSIAKRRRILQEHVARLLECRLCPKMGRPPVSGGAVLSRVLLVGQAPGAREPVLGRPFAWTAGKRLFSWFEEWAGIDEEKFRAQVYMAAVCRCFPGRNPAGGDRVPNPEEIEKCAQWLEGEIELLEPELVIPVGRLAIERFVPCPRMEEVIGRAYRVKVHGREFDVIPLPHPSGASPWPRMEPGKTLLARAMKLIARHPAFPSQAGPEKAPRQR